MPLKLRTLKDVARSLGIDLIAIDSMAMRIIETDQDIDRTVALMGVQKTHHPPTPPISPSTVGDLPAAS